MASSVFYSTAGGRYGQGPLDRVRMLFEAAGLNEVVGKRDLVAVKMHFGERGNTSYIPIPFIREIVDLTMKAGGRPFLTDTGTLYMSKRINARDHLIVAAEHGFGYQSCLAPVLIADGLRGSDIKKVEVNLKHFQ